ncbi:MAG: SMC-Scp complex subunit ScpB [Gammaproteobacteria bacterium]|nr:SMC-Scp complex subunit ScpB [Gammaproteobacteria bacterium]MBT8133622.1 SMC-Scp complex subunit ScpB [Gammaproteobacteria bacterium]NNJ49713.1 SMC-Scp complex subunit ScpB [Gammaproteobacteria bacterium]
MEINKLKNILEAVLLATERTLTVVQLEALFELDEERPTRDEIRQALHEMEEDYQSRGFELKQVASGYRLQVKQEFSIWVGRLWEEKPARYTRALLETMALIAYRQPITRGEIEEVRGVSVSSNIIKTLLERDWIKVLGHKDVPGKPTLYGTTKEFLDYFNLKKLDELPTLAEIKDLDSIHPELELDEDAGNATPGEGSEGEEPATDAIAEEAVVAKAVDDDTNPGQADSAGEIAGELEKLETVVQESEDDSVEEDAETVRSAFNV